MLRQTNRMVVDTDGTIFWLDDEGLFHNEHAPAIFWTNGTQEYYLHGVRVDGGVFDHLDALDEVDETSQTSDEDDRGEADAGLHVVVDSMGNKFWKTDEGVGHRVGAPAAIMADGTRQWMVNGKLHRTDGPAVEGCDGRTAWFVNGLRHRLDGPAVVWPNGKTNYWMYGLPAHSADIRVEYERLREASDAEPYVAEWRVGERHWLDRECLHHRLDGPAVEYPNGHKEWWLHGQQVSEAEVKQAREVAKLKLHL